MTALDRIDWISILASTKTVAISFGGKLLVALIIFYVGRIVAKMLVKGIHKVMRAQEVDQILETFVCNLAYWMVMVFVIIAAISQIGVQTTSFIAVMGAAGLAVGLALQGSLSNFAAGVLIVVFRPYRVGDFVEVAGISGSVVQVQILSTILNTGDNKQIVVPNAQIMNSIITNYSANNTRRVDMIISVSYDDNLDKVRNTLRELVNADSRIMQDPECLIAVAELADSSVNFFVRPWVASSDYWAVKLDLTESIKKRFDQDGISFPFPQQDVHLYKQE
ncbi:MAG: mechanosensitive ion channel [Woeseia sp.]|nr:mechanosensitive ion channel [Woeseia sp.]MBT6209361.1 mechanosensitive ion channel [Woeseia sp.]